MAGKGHSGQVVQTYQLHPLPRTRIQTTDRQNLPARASTPQHEHRHHSSVQPTNNLPSPPLHHPQPRPPRPLHRHPHP
jgi:hypothetical protein